MNTATLLGIRLLYEQPKEWLACISSLLNSKENNLTQLNTVNLEIFSIATQNSKYREILRKSELNVIDGYPVSFLALFKRGIWVKRICGSDFIYDLLKICERENKGVLLLGSTEHRNKLAVENVKKRYPKINVVGYSPKFPVPLSIGEDKDLMTLIEQNKFSAVAVCFGPPRQENWIASNMEFLERNGVRIATGLGGVIDFLSMEIKRAPCIFRYLGMEWLWRCLLEPKRIKRYAKSVWVLAKYAVRKEKPSSMEQGWNNIEGNIQ